MVGGRIAQRIEEPPATTRMPPALGIHTLGIGAHVEKFRPRLIVELRGLERPRQVRLTAVGKFDFGTFSAVRTIDEQHGALSAPRPPPRPRRSRTRHGSARW